MLKKQWINLNKISLFTVFCLLFFTTFAAENSLVDTQQQKHQTPARERLNKFFNKVAIRFNEVKETAKEKWNQLVKETYKKFAVRGCTAIVADHTLADVVGLEALKEELLHLLEQILAAMTNRNSDSGLHAHSYCFVGPRGSGKTHLVTGFVGSLQEHLKKLDFPADTIKAFRITPNLVEKYGIEKIITWIIAHAPAVVFFDEIDLFNLRRDANNKDLSGFLTELNRLSKTDLDKPIVVFFATNMRENLDVALHTYSRLGKEIYFEYPNFDDRKIFLVREITSLGFNVNRFDVEILAHEFSGESYETMRYLLGRACERAHQYQREFTEQVIIETIDIELRELQTYSSKTTRRKMAVHFAGQAIARILFPSEKQLARVSIKTKKGQLVEYEQMNEVVSIASQDVIVNNLRTFLAGFVAQEVLLGFFDRAMDSESYQKAFVIAEQLILGKLDARFSTETIRDRYSEEILSVIEECKEEIRLLFEEDKELLEKVANKLYDRESLSGIEIEQMISEFSEKKRLEILALMEAAEEAEKVRAEKARIEQLHNARIAEQIALDAERVAAELSVTSNDQQQAENKNIV